MSPMPERIIHTSLSLSRGTQQRGRLLGYWADQMGAYSNKGSPGYLGFVDRSLTRTWRLGGEIAREELEDGPVARPSRLVA